VEGETVCCSETCVKCDVGGAEEVSIKVEEAIDTKDEIPEAISFPRIKIEETIDPSDEIPEAVSFPPIKTEEAIDSRDEIPEAISLPPIKTEQEVRLWGCV
jgi:hypothetical protein